MDTVDEGGPPLPPDGDEIAGRYRLGAPLGQGSQGCVYRALDQLTGEQVAVKLFSMRCDPVRIRREIGVLRILRLPGVVRLIEDGVHEGRSYLVMERVDGAPFPGVAQPVRWSQLAGPTLSLLEILARMHAAGIVHRDLKPANVMVDARGGTTVVDFGVSMSKNVPSANDHARELVGTPAYLSPEQIMGEAASPSTDLYALGVMLYEALVGHCPHSAATTAALYVQRVGRAAPSLQRAPGVPPAVANVVDRLLALRPEQRPRSAEVVLAMLAESRLSSTTSLPWLGPDRITAVFEALAAGRSVTVIGPHGSGRSRLLEEVGLRLQASERRVFTVAPARTPYCSIGAVLAHMGLVPDGPPDLRDEEIVARLEAFCRDGGAIVVDDIDAADAGWRALIDRLTPAGAVLRAEVAIRPALGVDRVILADLEEDELSPLFLGPERVFHGRSRATRLLHATTGGRAARVAAELERWERAGIVHRWRDRFVANPSRLEELEARPGSVATVGFADVEVPAHLSELRAWVMVAGAVAVDVLVRASGRTDAEIVGGLAELEALGLVQRVDNRVVFAGRVVEVDHWDESHVRAAHRALAAALPPASPHRLFHLLAGEGVDAAFDPTPVASEALALARRHVEEGRLARATAWLADGLTAVRRSPDSDSGPLLAEWLRVALLTGTASALDQVLAELARSDAALAIHLESLARASITALTVGGARALSMVENIPPFGDRRLELERHGTRVLAARRCDLATERAIVAGATAWACASGDAEARARAAVWAGRLCYREHRFAEAALLHHAAAEATGLATVRIAALLDAASSEMEDLQLGRALGDAERARAEAAAHHCIFHEGRAEWLLRTAGYRSGSVDRVDDELIEIASRIGSPELEAQILFAEAAIAYRAGALAVGRAHGARAARVWAELGMRSPSALAAGVAVACGDVLDEARWQWLLATADAAWDPIIALQILGLACLGAPARAEEAAPRVGRLLAEVVPRYVDARMDVLTPREAAAAAGVTVG